MTEGEYDHRRLDRLIHSRIRLAVMAILASVEDAEFTYLRDQVETTDGNLATHLQKLEEAEYLESEKEYVGQRPVTRYRLTGDGRDALTTYVDRMAEMLDFPGGRSP